MKRLRIRHTILFLLSVFLFAHAQAIPLADYPLEVANPLDWDGVSATILGNHKGVSLDIVRDHRHYLTLSDKTQVAALYFAGEKSSAERPLPLLIANFGMFTDEYSQTIPSFLNALIQSHRLNADLLIVSNVTSASFFGLNQEMGVGGYDEGRILVELAGRFGRANGIARPVYLLGVSLGGNAVVHALLEDQRLRLHRLQGGIIFSAVLDQEESAQALFEYFGHHLTGIKPGALNWVGQTILSHSLKSMIPGLGNDLDGKPLDLKNAGDFFYRASQKRLQRIYAGSTGDVSWNAEVATDSLEHYIHTSARLLQNLKNIEKPLIVVASVDDPIIPFDQFSEFAYEQRDNPKVLTHSTYCGGHWGFISAYGADWMYGMVSKLLSP